MSEKATNVVVRDSALRSDTLPAATVTQSRDSVVHFENAAFDSLPSCPGSGDTVFVTDSSIGSIPMDASYETVRNLCPTAAQLWVDIDIVGGPDPGLVLRFGRAIVQRDSNESNWDVRGRGVSLTGNLPLDSAWPDYLRAYGDKGYVFPIGGESVPNGAGVVFCKHPQLFLLLNTDPESIGTLRDKTTEEALPLPLSRVPPSARVYAVEMGGGTWRVPRTAICASA